jgi:hypothetical protein
MPAQVRLDLGGRGRPVDLGDAPLLGVGAERNPAGPRVEVGAAGQVRRDLSQEPLGVRLAVKGFVALPAGVIAPTNIPSPAPAVPGRRDLAAAIGSPDGAIPPVVNVSHG